jgi:hypothetical protein
VAPVVVDGVTIQPRPVVHTSHPTYGYLIRVGAQAVVWAPEFWQLPDWVAGVDLLFADGAAWRHPLRFAGGVGGHAAVLDTAARAARAHVGRLVFAHIGRPTLRAIDAGEHPPFGEFGRQGATYEPAPGPPRAREPGLAKTWSEVGHGEGA